LQIKFTEPIIWLAAALSLSACTYSEINPQRAQEQVREDNGYYELGEVEPGTAKLVVRSRGFRYPVHYEVSSSPQACTGFEPIGNVAFFGQGVVYPWISRATRFGSGDSETYLVHEIANPGRAIQLQALGSWAAGTGVGYRKGRCGPIALRFTPEAGHAYTADFFWRAENSCSLAVMDATVPDAPVPVQAVPVAGCSS